MSKLNIALFFCVLLVTVVNPTQAVDQKTDESLLKEFLDAFVNHVHTIRCLANSCDPLAINKVFDATNLEEDILSSQRDNVETDEFKTLKLSKAIEFATMNMLMMEPKCNDPTFVCPYRVFNEIPQSIVDYTTKLETMIENTKCIPPNRVQEAIDILGKCITYAEQFTDHKADYLKRVIPPIEYSIIEFGKLCAQA
ncbi:uncharacterized protein LOC131996745 [Stomoxys calcitrans]|uniref:Uncharacterized protein n=1 Tax=Stomoxys calcitrans TaxID=35570 RepID=A0A1I8QB75_STOCA|nr:uncharacterized protein LOC131996745 [Stomoxys calcitrans]